jgi:pimeloyl-ACP methyl ester carboxylesterase
MGTSVLVVAVRGWTTSGERLLFGRPGSEIRADFIAALTPMVSDAEVWAPDLDMAMFSMRSAESLSLELLEKIGAKVAASPGVERIVIVGYSSGSLLARRVFCMAHGALPDGTVSGPPARWADKIDRMVILAGITRGWEYSSASPAHVRFLAPVLHQLTRLVGWWKMKGKPVESSVPFIQQLRRGSPFVISTRIQYINVLEVLRKRRKIDAPLRVNGLPSTVFLLGARDEFISPADCTELGPRVEFAFVDLPGSNHIEALHIVGDDPVAIERKNRLAAVIGMEFDALIQEPWAIPAEDIDDYLNPMDVDDDVVGASKPNSDVARPAVEHAILVVHGIRDNGFWTKRVAREIKTLARKANLVVRTPTPSYGYFSMWEFIKPGGRQQATYWFMERYADVKTRFPAAKISFVGHSNGTYIAAHALEICPAIRFENVVFAGSVIRRDFNWGRFRGRVGRVLNYVGSVDSVVAFLPAAFEYLRLRRLDVGGAGAFGFTEPVELPAADSSGNGDADAVELRQVRFVKGGHGAAIAEQFWPEIARFALFGDVPTRPESVRRYGIALLYQCAPAFTAIAGAVAVILLTLPLSVAAIVAGLIAQNGTPYGLAVALAALAVSVSLFLSWLVGRFLRTW